MESAELYCKFRGMKAERACTVHLRLFKDRQNLLPPMLQIESPRMEHCIHDPHPAEMGKICKTGRLGPRTLHGVVTQHLDRKRITEKFHSELSERQNTFVLVPYITESMKQGDQKAVQ